MEEIKNPKKKKPIGDVNNPESPSGDPIKRKEPNIPPDEKLPPDEDSPNKPIKEPHPRKDAAKWSVYESSFRESNK